MVSKKLSFLLFLGIFFLGSLFRITNLSPFNIYPDAYQSLIGAQNITDYHSVVGYLGTNGMLYPDFFSWTHPLYPILINFVTLFVHNTTMAGRLIAFFAGVLAIPLAFFYSKNVFKTPSYGLAAAFLIAFSFNHTVWSGFLMTETTGVFMMLLFLISFFAVNKNKRFGDTRTIISGTFFALAVLTRYEYAIILIPITLSLIINGKQFLRLMTFLIACGVTLSLFLWQLYPLPSTFTVIGDQLGSLIIKEGMLLITLFIVSITIVFLPSSLQNKLVKLGSALLIGFLWLISGYLLLQWLLGSALWPFYTDLSALRHFIMHDILLSTFALIGFTMLIKDLHTRINGIFSFLAIVCLFIMYHHTNSAMERYMTHLIPFLLIPASYGFVQMGKLIAAKKRIQKYGFIVLLSLLILFQALITLSGMKYSQDASWYRLSYEDRAAKLVKTYLSHNNNMLLVTSYPEPYYNALHLSTQSIADDPPYLFLDGVKENQKILIIEDMGMHDDFPHFTQFLHKSLSKNKTVSFWVHEKFHYIADVQKETYPVILYETTLKELEIKIKNQTE